MGSGDDGAHSQNEKIDVRNYIEGVSIVLCSKNVVKLVNRGSITVKTKTCNAPEMAAAG